MKQTLKHIIRYYGREVTLETEAGPQTVRAFLQPITAKSWKAMQTVVSGLGEVPPGQYLYLGPAAPMAEEGRLATCGGEGYRVCRAELLVIGDQALYTWGLLVKGGGDELWNS